MIVSEIIANWPEFTKLNAESILASPGYAAKCNWPTPESTLTFGGKRPGIALALQVRFGNNNALLGIPDDEHCAELFPTLANVLQSQEVPEPLLLAVVENDLAPLFQLLEEISEEHLQILGIAPADDGAFGNARVFRILSNGQEQISFLLTLTPELIHDFGQLKHLNPMTPEIGDKTLPAQVMLAKFSLSQKELQDLAPGDRILLPECPPDSTPWKVQVIVADKFQISATLDGEKLTFQSVPVLWQGSDELGVFAGNPIPVTLPDLLKMLQKGATLDKCLEDAGHLRLCTLATNQKKLVEGSLQPLENGNTLAVEFIAK